MHRWKISALAAAAFVSAALTTTDAAALALGTLQVRSALGENLNAEIAIPQATAAELSSLVAQIASAETFRAQGLDYSGSARSVQVRLHRNADGTASLRLSSNTPIQDPFVDLVVEAQWGAGQIARSYTLLLDPPAIQRAAPTPSAMPQIAPAPASVTGRSYNSNAPRPAAAPAPAVTPTPKAEALKDTAATSAEETVNVRAGDTAGRIANANRPAGVSLDQMLVAMLRSNPDAFINGNVNRIRAGAVVQMPNREQALATPSGEARQIVAAQSRDFNAYRRSLASKAPQATVQAADRSSSGQVQAHIADTGASAPAPDKLTLSKGAVQNAAAEAKLAEQKQASDQDNRLSELQRNLAELNQLSENTEPSTTAAATSAASSATPSGAAVPAIPAPAAPAATEATSATGAALEIASATAATASDAAATDAATASTTAGADTAPTTTDSPNANPAVTPPAPAAAPSLTDDLRDHPLLPAAGGLLILLLGLLGYTAWKRRRAAQTAQDTSLGDSQLQPDSFFGSSGGQQIDTSHADGGASTMAYAPSQLDGGGDVDPVAEADVYLAYGRDVQAEEILKEALRTQPERLPVHTKLAEIYVKRHDIKGLEEVARGMQKVSDNDDPEWQRVADMGRRLDPSNTFFASIGAATGAVAASQATSAFAAALSSAKPEPSAETPAAQPLPPIDLNVDLPDDGLSQPTASALPTASTAPLPSEDDYAALEMPGALDSQLDLSTAPVPLDPPTQVQDTQIADVDNAPDGLDLDLSGFEMLAADAAASAASEAAATDKGLNLDLEAETPDAPATAPADEAFDFDLGSLDLDLGPTAVSAGSSEPVHNLADDPLSTKLDLAQEFNSIGDSEGARALIEEVLAEASGSLKERAQKMLSDID